MIMEFHKLQFYYRCIFLSQFSEDSNVNRDVYVPNPSCKDFLKYEWIGQLMGACLRGKENLVISLPSFIWKKLVGEQVTWSRDYSSIDAAEVGYGKPNIH